jgi:hypothetical protein
VSLHADANPDTHLHLPDLDPHPAADPHADLHVHVDASAYDRAAFDRATHDRAAFHRATYNRATHDRVTVHLGVAHRADAAGVVQLGGSDWRR